MLQVPSRARQGTEKQILRSGVVAAKNTATPRVYRKRPPLESQNINHTYINLLKIIYKNSTVNIQLQSSGNSFKIRRGVKQGDPLSPKLFTSALEEIFKKLSPSWSSKGINICDKQLTNLRFADDIVLFSTSAAELETMLQEISVASLEVGLKMNMTKTQLMCNSTKHMQSRSRRAGLALDGTNNFGSCSKTPHVSSHSRLTIPLPHIAVPFHPVDLHKEGKGERVITYHTSEFVDRFPWNEVRVCLSSQVQFHLYICLFVYSFGVNPLFSNVLFTCKSQLALAYQRSLSKRSANNKPCRIHCACAFSPVSASGVARLQKALGQNGP
ncbi:reverse transcriptase (RNA-dependent DNA polymerase) domain-containing protein [Phthorimaea operculella]|nr:reverse transcriptase (RNA-dependent DNA polymerase) domain-containing protein [Phthorimaea operculella]